MNRTSLQRMIESRQNATRTAVYMSEHLADRRVVTRSCVQQQQEKEHEKILANAEKVYQHHLSISGEEVARERKQTYIDQNVKRTFFS